jgi:hypothetical protein
MQCWAIYNPETGEMLFITCGQECYIGYKSAWDMSVRDWESFCSKQNQIVEDAKTVLKTLKNAIPEQQKDIIKG